MELTGKFKTEFEKWLRDNGCTPKYFEALGDGNKESLIIKFIEIIGLDENNIQESIKTFNEYFDNI